VTPTLIITLITALLPVISNAIPSISAEFKTIIADISASLGAVFSSGVIQTQNASTVLLALSGVIAALKAEPAIPPAVLGLLGALDRAAQAALAADQQAQVVVDPGTLHPITPVA
jgi:hypothetical protein